MWSRPALPRGAGAARHPGRSPRRRPFLPARRTSMALAAAAALAVLPGCRGTGGEDGRIAVVAAVYPLA
ncbi:MAG: hypothetical protein HY658_09005, partial [Actinobacteria bacterium]|nr:hypothetical protein [Actinomycetota bacterium]